MTRTERRAILAAAREAALRSDHERARELFARVGCGYVTPEAVARWRAEQEGN